VATSTGPQGLGGDHGDKSVGELVSRISEQASTLVREEIELAKTEMEIKAKRLGRGAAVGAAAGFFAIFALIYAFQALAWGLNDLFESLWLGFVIVMALFIVLGAIAGLIAKRLFEAGTPPLPQQAIEQAKLTREALEHPELVPAGMPEAAGRTSVASGQLPGTEAAPSDSGAKEG
jgi:uncharacterized membrane protein YqjE